MALVSVIIPCYNAARWVAEAVDSCLAQTYVPIEVIVVDDGSTDESVAILRRYGERIRLVTQANSGGNCARNRGFALSQGAYIQFLDADDYLLPEKIARQVRFLEETGADVVYGDWRYQFHEGNGHSWHGDINISAEQADILASLLRGWWTANLSILFRRQTVIDAGGWDESIKAGQDRDFFLSVAMTGDNIRYQPGCYSVYRRYGNVTVGTGNDQRFFRQHGVVLEKAELKLRLQEQLTQEYRECLAQSYFVIARGLFDYDFSAYRFYLRKAFNLSPSFTPPVPSTYLTLQRIFGYVGADLIASLKRKLLRWIGSFQITA